MGTFESLLILFFFFVTMGNDLVMLLVSASLQQQLLVTLPMSASRADPKKISWEVGSTKIKKDLEGTCKIFMKF